MSLHVLLGGYNVLSKLYNLHYPRQQILVNKRAMSLLVGNIHTGTHQWVLVEFVKGGNYSFHTKFPSFLPSFSFLQESY